MEGRLEGVIAARDEVSKIVQDRQERRAALDAERAALDAEIASLTTEMEGLNLYIARHGVKVTTASPDEAVRWHGLPRTDAIVEALHTMNQPASPKEISDQLRRMGRKDDPADVSRALNRLKDQNRAVSPERGLWAPPDTSGQDMTPHRDHESLAEKRPDEEEGMGSDAATRVEGALM